MLASVLAARGPEGNRAGPYEESGGAWADKGVFLSVPSQRALRPPHLRCRVPAPCMRRTRQGFPRWAEVMDAWGAKMLRAVELVSTAAAVGFGLDADAITDLMRDGPHLLAPTGSDLAAHGELGTVLAGYHYDLNLLTIHGRRCVALRWRGMVPPRLMLSCRFGRAPGQRCPAGGL